MAARISAHPFRNGWERLRSPSSARKKVLRSIANSLLKTITYRIRSASDGRHLVALVGERP